MFRRAMFCGSSSLRPPYPENKTPQPGFAESQADSAGPSHTKEPTF